MELRREAPAKINLFLRVGERGDRPGSSGGFHPLETWMCTVSLFDTLRLHFDREAPSDRRPSRATLGGAERPAFSLACDDPRLPNDARNLVMRAMSALADAELGLADAMPPANAKRPGVEGEAPPAFRAAGAASAFLNKRIPSGAGLGGGSSDAATTLLLLNDLWELGLSVDRLALIAAQLGSDVPFFLHSPSAICAGRGEIIRPISAPILARWAVLILPGIELSTPAVYQRFDEMELGDPSLMATTPDVVADAASARWSGRASLAAEDLLALLVNDLEPAAFSLRPDLGELRTAIEQTLDNRPVRMSGSGSAMFTLYHRERDARDAADKVTSRHSVRTEAVEIAPAPIPSSFEKH
ncbi:MAG: 4-(cytidine 5'-diphospho)-2-C-methyl-D-erythritol kinase [Chthoniobacterales bacterium]|nr:4-(cytidine 5'-diphospho)-2-C-methyl-D-erythritol kinase [Chthoniobacterales bacterium]